MSCPRLQVIDGHLAGVRMRDGTVVARQSLVVAPRTVARCPVLATLGLLPTDHPMGTGEFAAADATGLTDVPGVWVAGNVTDLAAGVVTAAAAPAAGAAINADLIAEDTRKAIVAYRSSHRIPAYGPAYAAPERVSAGAS